ncbi:MAG: DNRLRE domain-containing protein [Chloroflexi bacterium]|nr:DNRLRE domain-containing protein [Chloroflexota bacterium]
MLQFRPHPLPISNHPSPTNRILKRLGVLLCLVCVLVLTLPLGTIQAQGPGEKTDKVRRYLRVPPAQQVTTWLQKEGQLSLGASAQDSELAVSTWYQQFQKTHNTGPDPVAWTRLQRREKALLQGDVQALSGDLTPVPSNILGLVVEFAGTDRIVRPYPDPETGACVNTEFQFQPLALGQDPPPGPRDNFSFYKADMDPQAYDAVLFGIGPDAPGYGVVRPELGGIDLSGLTLNNYLLEMSAGTYHVGGAVLPRSVSLPHAPETYGYALYQEDAQGRCQADPASDAGFLAFAEDAVKAMVADYPDQAWSQFDANGDHVVDMLFLIHAGYGWQDGGGEDRLSDGRSSFSLNGLAQPQIAGQQTPDDPSDDYFVDNFAVFSEQTVLGTFLETFEHYLGLPDLYTLDGMNANGFWGSLAAGVWGGPLGGVRPVGHNLWQNWLLGWKDPLVIEYDDPSRDVVVGRLRQQPPDTADGIIIRLPPKEVEVENRAGSGGGWWSGSENNLDHRIWREFDLSQAGEHPIFSFDAYWDLENGWDYGYIEVSTDAGATWISLPDQDGYLTRDNPHGRNQGWGLTGRGQGRLHFDLSAFRGLNIRLRLRYVSDRFATEPGWWVDNLSLDDEQGNLYSNELETVTTDWHNEGWLMTPFVKRSDHYYLVEWRDANGFDQSLNDPYQIVYQDKPNHETKVNRLPATTPSLIISYRDLSQPFDGEMLSDLASPPSYGPKYGLLVVDSHYWPQRFDTTSPAFQDAWVGVPLSGRVMPGDAGFGLLPTRAWTARLGWDFDTQSWSETPLETKSWPSQAAIPAFHDSLNYTPGFFYPGSGSLLYLHDWDASAVIPARFDYATPITWPDGLPYPDLYGVEVAPGRLLGTGNPGDVGAQYGLHIQVLSQSPEQATVRVWNAMHEVAGTATTSPASAPVGEQVTVAFSAQNVGSAAEFFAFAPLPAGTRYVPGSVSGDLFPVGLPAAQILANWQTAAQKSLLGAASANEISGFAYLGALATGESMAGSFAITLEPGQSKGDISASLIFYADQQPEPFRVLSTTLTIENTPPSLNLPPDQQLNEGSTLQVTASFSDPDADNWSGTVDYGDGSPLQSLQLAPDHSFVLEHLYPQDGVYTVTVTMNDGEATSEGIFTVVVSNVPPSFILPATATLDEGDTLQVNGKMVDPGEDVWVLTVDYGDGAGMQPLSLATDHSFILEHLYTDNGVYTVTVSADDGEDVGIAQIQVIVDNVSPQVQQFDVLDAAVGDVVTATVAFVDPGNDVWSATLDFGDGTAPLVLNDVAPQFEISHVYAAAGVYVLTLTVGDDDGGVDVATTQAHIWTTVSLPLSADTWVNGGDPARNYDAYAALIVRPTGLDDAFLTFDRTLLPPEADIRSAQLTLNVILESGAAGKYLQVLNVTPFESAQVNYDNAPATYNPGTSVPVQLGQMVLDVSAQVQAWTNDIVLGQLAIAATGPRGRISLASLESWPAGQEAQLAVTFVP